MREGGGLQYCIGGSGQSIPKKKKYKKAKWLSEEAYSYIITEKRKDVKGKGEKERYIHLNPEF